MEMKPKQALITLPIVIVFFGVVVFYLSVFPFTAGLNWIAMCFVFFWTTIMHSDLKQIVPTFAGAILGLAIAAVPAVLGPMTSPLIGFVAFILLILALLYFFYVSQLKFVANPAAQHPLERGQRIDSARRPMPHADRQSLEAAALPGGQFNPGRVRHWPLTRAFLLVSERSALP